MLPSALLNKPKAEARKRRKRVTLIAAVPCGRAFAIAADSQETAGDYRSAVQKIAPIDLGGLKVIIAGSGNADLIDAFIEKVSRRFQDQTVDSLPEFVLAFEDELGKFVTLDVAVCADEDKSLTLFVGASNPPKKECGVWISRNITLIPLTEPKLIGWDEKLYKSIIRRYSYEGMTPAQAILASIYTLVIAEETSRYVNRPFYVAVVHPGGIYMEPPADVEGMANRLKEYEEHIKSIFLHCSDLGTSSLKLKDKLDEFSRTVIALHETHAEAEVKRLFAAGFDGRTWPYSKIPSGVQIAFTNTGEIEVTQLPVKEIDYTLKWEAREPPLEFTDMIKIENPEGDPGGDPK